MTVTEFSNEFDVLIDSYRRFKDFDNKENLDSLDFNEYEKSIFLTRAQEDIVTSFYNGLNYTQESFEGSEEIRRYLDALVKTVKISTLTTNPNSTLFVNSVLATLPLNTDVWYIVYESVDLEDSNLKCNSIHGVSVTPTKHDNLQRILKNPFKRPNERRVLRLDLTGNVVELISKYTISNYTLRYISKPEPIILTNLPNDLTINNVGTKNECKLNPVIHRMILEKAVQFALASKLGNNFKNNNPYIMQDMFNLIQIIKMATFSTNQVRQLYVANALTADAIVPASDAVGTIKVNGDTAKTHLYFQYLGKGGLVRSDLIETKNILSVKASDADSMKRPLKKQKVVIDANPIAGQDYILRVLFSQFIGITEEDKYVKYGAVRATTGMTKEAFYETLLTSLEKNFFS